jgi:hypothetical protein
MNIFKRLAKWLKLKNRVEPESPVYRYGSKGSVILVLAGVDNPNTGPVEFLEWATKHGIYLNPESNYQVVIVPRTPKFENLKPQLIEADIIIDLRESKDSGRTVYANSPLLAPAVQAAANGMGSNWTVLRSLPETIPQSLGQWANRTNKGYMLVNFHVWEPRTTQNLQLHLFFDTVFEQNLTL